MPYNIDMIDLIVKEAIEHKYELPWIELKENNYDPQLIGEYISALSNTAALYNQEHAFLIWGVEDNSHKVVGTDFEPQAEKIGNQGLELWLATQLNPQVQFYFHTVNLEGKRVVLLEIGRAFSSPVKFKNIDYKSIISRGIGILTKRNLRIFQIQKGNCGLFFHKNHLKQ